MKILIIIVVLLLCITIFIFVDSVIAYKLNEIEFQENLKTDTKLNNDNENNNIDKADSIVFPHNKVVDVKIDIDESVYNNMIENALKEEMVCANIEYNGYNFNNVGIRPKGNSSLRSVANKGSNRFSLKVDFNHYVKDQNIFGISKLNLNNLYSDPTMMSEYLSYEMLNELNADVARTTYIALYINERYFGLYLCVEQVDEAFLLDRFDNFEGEFYKPEMGVGSNLKYISEYSSDYQGMIDKNDIRIDNKKLIELIKSIDSGIALEDNLNIDSFLKYLALNTAIVSLDNYLSGMFHNYYLYNNNGIFEWIAWDFNMSFNGFPKSGISDQQAVGFLIDEPVIGSMDKYPIVKTILSNEEYVKKYHFYLNNLTTGYLSEDNFTNKVMQIYEMINKYVKKDPSAFYSYDKFKESIFKDTDKGMGLLNFVKARNENIKKQLDGAIPSANNGNGNIGTHRGEGRGQKDNKKQQLNDMKNKEGENSEFNEGEVNRQKNVNKIKSSSNKNLGKLSKNKPIERVEMSKDRDGKEKNNNRSKEGNLNKEHLLGKSEDRQSKHIDKNALYVNIAILSISIIIIIIFCLYINKKNI
ncbi:CotH kinase family protein [Clostridiaceae bacterium M8S5]|nr:CotH kinase family protein [Clostridiaceae bacterium M8S5]